jgi:hypothetical protein
MKAKLILKHRGDYDYFLISRTDNSEVLAASLNPDGYFEQKLSKQNCDELFGVVDVEKLAKNDPNGYYESDYQNIFVDGFINGFNKAMELNKDKVFTLSDISYAISFSGKMKPSEIVRNLLQQPTEIEVEIIMKNLRTGNIVKHDSDLEWDEDGLCDRAIPKLDSEGCLILKKIKL